MELRETFGATGHEGAHPRATPAPTPTWPGTDLHMTARPSSCWPAASPTSATSRCAPAGGWPRRCARPASRRSSATSTPACCRRCWPSRPTCVVPMLHGESGRGRRDPRGARPARRRRTSGPARRPAAWRSTSRSPSQWSSRPGVATPTSVCLPHETFRELGAAEVMDAVLGAAGAAAGRQARPQAAPPSAARWSCHAGRAARRRWSTPSPTGRWRSSSASSPGTEVSRARRRRRDRARAPCPRSRSGPTAASTTTPRATPPGPPSSSCRPALPDAVLAECARVAVAAHEALGLRDLSRSDLIVDDDGTVWFLEVNVAPGFTETSLVPLSVEAAGPRPGRGTRLAGAHRLDPRRPDAPLAHDPS